MPDHIILFVKQPLFIISNEKQLFFFEKVLMINILLVDRFPINTNLKPFLSVS